MCKTLKTGLIAALLFAGAAGAALAANPMVGGAAMYPSKNIIENAVNSRDHTTLVAAVKAAGLVDTLEGSGPFTVFAPNNKAFAALPAGTVDMLLKPQNKQTLTGVLTYHVVPGALTIADLKAKAAAAGGTATLATVNGAPLTVQVQGDSVFIGDKEGHEARVVIPDVMQSNGVIQGIDTVLMPM